MTKKTLLRFDGRDEERERERERESINITEGIISIPSRYIIYIYIHDTFYMIQHMYVASHFMHTTSRNLSYAYCMIPSTR